MPLTGWKVLDNNPQSSSLPHVDQVLGQGDGLCVAGDADGPVKVGRCVSVFAVRDPDHRARELSGYFYIYFIFLFLFHLYLYIYRARELLVIFYRLITFYCRH